MAERVYSAVERSEGETLPNESPEGLKDEAQIADFPVECLPVVLERMARGIGQLCGVPLGMSAPMVLANASISLGKGLRVRSLPGRVTNGNLFVMVSKTSGSGGSLTFRLATAPLIGMQKTLRQEFEDKVRPGIEAERLTINAQIEALTKKARQSADAEQRERIVAEIAQLKEKLAQTDKQTGTLLYVTDITPEKLADMLSEQGETLAHIDSDAADALGIIVGTRYGDGKHTQESLWLKGYSGEATVIFRKTGKPLHLNEPCLAVLFVATPDKVQELYRNSRLTSGGLLPRFLACDPGARPIPLDPMTANDAHKLPTDVSQPYESAVFAAISRYRISAADDPDEIEMTPAARGLLIADWNRFCAATDGAQDRPFESRHTENAIRIAVVLHAFRHVEITQRSEGTFNAVHHGHEHPLDEQTMGDALRIRDWFTLHQENMRKPQRAAADEHLWQKAQRLMRDRSSAVGITARDIYNGTGYKAPEIQRLLNQWKEEGRIEEFQRKPAGAGRPTPAYRLSSLVRR